MKKTLLYSLIALIGIMFLFTACNEPEEFENVLIGSWKHIDYQTGDWEKIIFDEDLDYTLTNYDAYYLTTSTYTGTYSYTDTTFTLEQRYSSDIIFQYVIDNDFLYVSPGKTYVRQ